METTARSYSADDTTLESPCAIEGNYGALTFISFEYSYLKLGRIFY